MQQYRDWSPTSWDSAGLNADENDIGDYYVMPIMQTRDSEALERSNFAVALGRLGGESETVRVHRFRHWACGWFDLLLVHPEQIQPSTTHTHT